MPTMDRKNIQGTLDSSILLGCVIFGVEVLVVIVIVAVASATTAAGIETILEWSNEFRAVIRMMSRAVTEHTGCCIHSGVSIVSRECRDAVNFCAV